MLLLKTNVCPFLLILYAFHHIHLSIENMMTNKFQGMSIEQIQEALKKQQDSPEVEDEEIVED